MYRRVKEDTRMMGGEREREKTPRSMGTRGTRGTVLVVDDDRALVGRVGRLLVAEGYRVLAARSLEALGVAHELRPGVIVLGPTLVGRDAAELLGPLRGLAATATIPVVALTGPGDQAGAAGLVADAVAPLPGDAGALCATLAHWLRAGRADAAA